MPGFPDSFPQIPLSWNLGYGFDDLFPVLKNSGKFGVERGFVYFSIIGLAYFISSEIGLSMGLSNIVLAIVGAQFFYGNW